MQLTHRHEREGEGASDEMAGVLGVETAAVQQGGCVGVEDDDGQARSGDLGVAAGAHVGEEGLEVLVGVPDVEREAL